MAGRPKKENKKIGEFIYLEPHLLQWLKERAEKGKTTTSVIVGLLIDKQIKKESGPSGKE